MGLDMYLMKRHYVKNWDHMKPEEKHKLTIKGPKAKEIKLDRVESLIEGVGYWRKANQIHAWFVNNVQNGNDDCKEYRVDIDELKELLSLVKEVIKKPTKAKELLPTQTGFFFGGEEYGEYYFQDLQQTQKMLEELIKEDPNGSADYYYQSSW